MASFIFKTISEIKTSTNGQGFMHGQVCFLLSVNHVDSADENYNVLIESHFANLIQTDILELKWGRDLLLLNGEGFTPKFKFPAVEEDVLLHLVLMGGKYHKALKSSFLKSLEETKKHQRFQLCFANSNQTSNDGQELEAMVAAAFVISSHQNGFSGTDFGSVLAHFLFEIDLVNSMTPLIYPPIIQNFIDMHVPFLSAPNVAWSLPLIDLLKLANFERSRNLTRIDCSVVGHGITFELKDHQAKFGLTLLESTFPRKPTDSKIHLIVTNNIIDHFYNSPRKETKGGRIPPANYGKFYKLFSL